ncbi:hypothetical protein K443DRAFT_377127 [Laccaria amethystina LaAM-08-1]|uniref:Actin-like ATPase domain-containing protein n=1 Tax=Laccaria amethystina LaAM-08-1 TaxID=1095629 RepID=A0A0C9XCA8_9AGAR|nr:hypothetical protein K443DRAFT_377127 [Laccaria amethystina LaAM-08-1]
MDHLGPEGSEIIPSLPLGKTAIDVLADFLRYLLWCARAYIEGTHANGVDLWLSVEKEIEFVLSHPNGWESRQMWMRKAAISSGLIPDDHSGHNRFAFITEGEANLHFSIHNGLSPSAFEDGDGVVIVDAGEETIDISGYARNSNIPPSFDEIGAPQCHFQGLVSVSMYARMFFTEFLSKSIFLEDLDDIVLCFERTVKPCFRNSEKPQFIKFGSARDNDASCNIRFGQLKLAGEKVAEFFEPSIQCIVAGVHEQRKAGKRNFTNVVLVGKFSACDWLYTQVAKRLKSDGFSVFRPDYHMDKAIVEGALFNYIDRHPKRSIMRSLYHASRKLALAFDIGTTHSGISYCILASGTVPQIKSVTRFRGQVNESLKIPTIIYYDASGKVRAVGAEAVQEDNYGTAEEEGWVKVEWFCFAISV